MLQFQVIKKCTEQRNVTLPWLSLLLFTVTFPWPNLVQPERMLVILYPPTRWEEELGERYLQISKTPVLESLGFPESKGKYGDTILHSRTNSNMLHMTFIPWRLASRALPWCTGSNCKCPLCCEWSTCPARGWSSTDGRRHVSANAGCWNWTSRGSSSCQTRSWKDRKKKGFRRGELLARPLFWHLNCH